MSTPNNWQWAGEPVDGGPAVVFDIDGVLCNADERQHFLSDGRRDWKSFFAACGGDTLIEETSRLIPLISADVAVVLLTGRPLEVQQTTIEWFDRHDLRWDLLIMRDRGDYTASLTFKQQTVRKLKTMGFDLQLAFEDDVRNQEMFQNEGVPCMYVHSGYYEQRDAMERAQ